MTIFEKNNIPIMKNIMAILLNIFVFFSFSIRNKVNINAVKVPPIGLNLIESNIPKENSMVKKK